MTKKELLDLLKQSEPTPQAVLLACCEVCELSLDEFQSVERTADICDARFIASYILRFVHEYRDWEIGIILRPKTPFERTSVLAQIRKARVLLSSNEAFKIKYLLVVELINGKYGNINIPEDILLREYDAYLKRKENCT